MSTAATREQRQSVRLPPRSDRLFRLFRWYARRYCAKHLHAVRLARWGTPPQLDRPAVIVMNHPSWWDPLIAYILSGLFANRTDWGVIDAAALKQYRFLGRAGLFGVQTGRRGASHFLKTALQILANPRATIWITGQGRFADVRERPLNLRSAVGHLARSMKRGMIVPLGLEMAFWDQRTPEALAAFGEPLDCMAHRDWSPAEWTATVKSGLEATQDRLAADAISRDDTRFDTLVKGRSGVGGMYDLWRRMASWVGGEQFTSEHRTD